MLGDRSRDDYLAHLLAKVGVEKAELHNARQGAGSARSSEGAVRTAENCRTVPSVTSVSSADGIPKLLGEFAGLTKQAAVDRILSTVCDWQPVGNKTRRELRDAEIWALWRFTSHSVRKISKIARLRPMRWTGRFGVCERCD